jgi:hypothetical protein
MSKSAKFSLLLVLVFSLTISAFAQNNSKKTEEFNKIAKLTQTKKPEDLEKAYKMAKDFLAQYGATEDDQVKKLKEFVEKHRFAAFNKSLDDLNIAQAYALGKESLAQEPENTYVVINLAVGGYDAFHKKRDSSFANEAVTYAKQALSLLEAGKLPSTFEPLKGQDETTAVLYYVIGNFTYEKDPAEAAKNFYKALQYESQIKTTSFPYYALAFHYEKAYENLANSYKTKVANKAPEAELLAEQEKLEKLIDRMLDAYARAIKFAEVDNKTSKDTWMQRFTQIYKHKNQSDAGMNEFLNSVANTPLPDPSKI